MARDDAAAPVLARVAAAADLARRDQPDAGRHARRRGAALARRAGRRRPAPSTVLAGARGLALRLAYALTAALLVEQAAWGDDAARTAARLWVRRWLRGEDVAVDAARDWDALV